jgi:hypothetical protein
MIGPKGTAKVFQLVQGANSVKGFRVELDSSVSGKDSGASTS